MGRTALHYAASNNEVEATKRLLKFGANINAQTIGGDTALIKATEMGYFDVVRELMMWNCDFRIANKASQNKTIDREDRRRYSEILWSSEFSQTCV